MDESSAVTLARYSPTSLPRAQRQAEADAEFLTIYQQQFDFVWRTVAGLAAGGSAVSVEDAVQDLWLTVARRLPDFRGESTLRTWLFSVAKNVVRNHRRRSFRKGGLEPLDESVAPSVTPEDDETLYARAVWHDVQLFMSSLEEPEREVFLARFLLEMTPREVARATGKNIVAVYSETRRLKGAFKRWHQTREDESR